MPNATIISAWRDATNAYAAAAVVEAGGKAVEYIASTPLLDAQGAAKNNPTLKADLTAALKVVRDGQQVAAQSALAGVSGTVVV